MNSNNHGWSDPFNKGIMTNPDPIFGGIIDQNLVTKKWFVIPQNDNIQYCEGFEVRDDAFEYLFDKARVIQLQNALADLIIKTDDTMWSLNCGLLDEAILDARKVLENDK